MSLPRGNAPSSSPVTVFPKPAVMRPPDPEDASKPVPKKLGGAALLAKNRAYVADDK